MTAQEKGMPKGQERIQQLIEAFPEIPRNLVVKADVLREGIKPNAASRQIGRWALPDAHWYFEYDREDTHTAEEATEGYTLSPVAAHFPDGLGFHIMFDSRSPYEFRYEGTGRHRLYRDGEAIEEVFFPHRPRWYDKRTSSGKPMGSVIALRAEDYLFVVPLTHCEYFNDNAGCRYCNINPSESVKKGLGMERLVAKREEDVYETCLAALQESDIHRLTMSGGVILDSSREAENYARMARALKRAMKDAGRDVPISVKCQALEAEDQMKVKEAGATSMGFNLEVWEPRLFEFICPGKSKFVGRQRWIDRMLQAVKVWGSTNTSFVAGIELAPPHGFKSEDEGAESFLEGCEWLVERGVSPGGSFWRPVPGTQFTGMPSPRTEYLLRISLAHQKLMVKHNKAPRSARPPTHPGQSIFGEFPPAS